MATGPRGLQYNPAFDGIRGIAILSVVVFHYTWFSAGWAGVQLFFVLSGFLITSILLAERDKPIRRYLGRFYWRRTLRIFPLYLTYLVILAASFAAFGVPSALREQWPYLFTYTFNFSGLFEPNAYSRTTGHLWSLSVEEQFYLVWPLVVFLIPVRWFTRVAMTLVLFGPVVRVLTYAFLTLSGDAGLLGRLPTSNIDAFAIGALVAGSSQSGDARHARWLFLVVSAVVLIFGQLQGLVAYNHFALDTGLGYPNGGARDQWIWASSLINTWAASLLVAATQPGRISGLLAWAPLVFVGRISYGMYVVHSVILMWFQKALGPLHGLANVLEFSVYLGFVVLVAAISYRWLETPFLKMKSRFFAAEAAA